ncbi:hypothetical protein A2627_02530 [Candidatus Woesebacteria bacterium RIFCSPHIGHO2_01_FULL_39_28]|uniref:Uncharacterized protein n=1 Tax=Candidatus Woesebacteria bacterium RIFCSPHIGHO2_01_FULL_39_28 TaxID=1802496 RepID=A0A1F7YI53_9BACT|nr:MAG: hypothetical protein A2627_02530 [Candidatus Woesebacteria bacterium RIFCSPHIGHO2_01_FULL_39_28]OGM57204.1 MAG: hypothetical protein A3A50_03390 [Candidatus Woesebacteria bacterium RIFCSPLOWO2_01_FULL_38_20]
MVHLLETKRAGDDVRHIQIVVNESIQETFAKNQDSLGVDKFEDWIAATTYVMNDILGKVGVRTRASVDSINFLLMESLAIKRGKCYLHLQKLQMQEEKVTIG